MSFQKALCSICECPTADGAVLAVHVDQEKLQTWFLNVCEYEMDQEIYDDDLICYFCAWHAEFQWNFDEMADEDLVWWNLDLDDAAKELRNYYYGGQVEQCWVTLEKVKLSESEEENDEFQEDSVNEKQTNLGSEKKKCFYCGSLYKYLRNLSTHLKKRHKDAVRCEHRQCAKYFHTIEEREKHNEEVHEKPRELKTIKCDFCGKEFKGSSSYTKHVRKIHPEFPAKCAFLACFSYFKSDNEMRAHFDSLHKCDDGTMIDCEYCEYKAKTKRILQRHVARKHMAEKTIKCDKCSKMLATNGDLLSHVTFAHQFKCCKICTLDVAVGYFTQHIRKCTCVRCKKEIRCSGLYRSHLKKCRKTLFKCSKCPKSFQWSYLLILHMKRKHGNREWRGLEYKALGFKCEPCKRYYKSANILKQHLNRIHNQAKLKYCAHCPKSFYSTFNLKNHLAVKHNLLALQFECNECHKQFHFKCSLNKHLKREHN